MCHGAAPNEKRPTWETCCSRRKRPSGFAARLQLGFERRFSADDLFVAYCSDESGQDEVQVQAFPEGQGQEQVSTNGGCQPRWSRDGGAGRLCGELPGSAGQALQAEEEALKS